jgi:hypothetical protein
MSTTFGVKVDTKFTGYELYPYDAETNSQEEEGIYKIAFRSGNIIFTNPIAHLLPDETPVIPLDNTAQGIYTIGDIKKHIEGQWKS